MKTLSIEEVVIALVANGLSVRVDEDGDGFIEIHASKDGHTAIMYHTSLDLSYAYTGNYNCVDGCVKYMNSELNYMIKNHVDYDENDLWAEFY